MHPRDWIGLSPLAGTHVRLEPLSPRHFSDLYRSTPPDTFRYFVSWPEPWTPESFGAHLDTMIADPGRVHYAVIDAASGAAVGSTSFLEIRPAHRGLEIGFTWYAPSSRGTRVNPESKLLMLTHAFQRLGCLRVQLKCDALNAHSRAAITKLGARFEGVLRQHLVKQDGVVRDTAMFSITRAEWPEVRAGLARRVE